MPNLSQFFPEIQNRMVYAHAQTFPLSNQVMFYVYAHAQTFPKIQPRGPTHAQQYRTCFSSFLQIRKRWFMRMRRLFMKSNHGAQLVHHNAKLVAVLS
jgi:hypothetical protein